MEIDITKGTGFYNAENWDDGTIAQWTKGTATLKVKGFESASKLSFYIPTAVGAGDRTAKVVIKKGTTKLGEGKLKLGNIGTGVGIVTFDAITEEDVGKDITITITTPTFLASEVAKNDDSRKLGLCLSKVTLE